MYFEVRVMSDTGLELGKIIRPAVGPSIGHFEGPLSEENYGYALTGFELKPILRVKNPDEVKTDIQKAAERGFNSTTLKKEDWIK